MKAIVQHGYGSPEDVLAFVDVERPSVGDGDVLIRVRATSVNTPDWIAVTGVPRVLRLKTGLRRPGTPIRGTDVAGVVEAVGRDVVDVRPGDEVFGSIWNNQPVQRDGTFAEFTVAPATQVIARPESVGFAEAAASVMAGLTALLALRDVGQVGPDTRVLVNGAAGGVGSMAVQIAKALGADVTGVCSTSNVGFVRSLGADRVIDYTRTSYTEGGRRYDVILDNVMNHPPTSTARALAHGGVLIPNSVGTGGGLLGALPRAARAVLLGRLGSTRVATVTCVVNRANLSALADLLGSGHVRVPIGRTYGLSDAAQAMAHMLTHHARGKIALTV